MPIYKTIIEINKDTIITLASRVKDPNYTLKQKDLVVPYIKGKYQCDAITKTDREKTYNLTKAL